MYFKLNRFLTTEEVRKEYRIPESIADEILTSLPVVTTSADGTQFHLENDVDEALDQFSQRRRKVEQPAADIVAYGPIHLSKANKEVTIYNKTYPLDAVFSEVLACLIASKGGWVARSDMQAFSETLQFENRLDRIIERLRKTISVLNKFIESSPRGYRIVFEPTKA